MLLSLFYFCRFARLHSPFFNSLKYPDQYIHYLKSIAMKRKITILIFILLTGWAGLHAQTSYVNRVIVLNEGHYDYVNQVQLIPVTVGAYNPVTHSYTTFDTIPNARFATHVIVDGSGIYVAADNQLIRYDIDTYQ